MADISGSILNTVKKMLGIAEDYNAFDLDIIVFINSALMALEQMGVGTPGYSISGEAGTWGEFLGESADYEADAKTYIYYRVRIAFDPPSSSFVLDAYKELMKEAEWRLNAEYETPFRKEVVN